MANHGDLHDLLDLAANPPDGPVQFDSAAVVTRSRQRRRRRTLIAAIAGVVALGVAVPVGLAHDRNGPTGSNVVATNPPPSAAGANVASLVTGRWSVLPPAPIVPRIGASVVWTGQELLVWGGASGQKGDVLHADGAAFDPSTNQWRSLPASPLTARVGQSAVWTGSEMIMLGGYDLISSNNFHVTKDGAAYNPQTNQWRTLPDSPLSARTGAIAVWSGTRAIFLGGRPAVTTGNQGFEDGATYDPTSNSWQRIEPPASPNGHFLAWRAATQADRQLLAWSTSESGISLFAYDEPLQQWKSIPTTTILPNGDQVPWTGEFAIVRGSPRYCDGCSGPLTADVTDRYDPKANTWTRLPPDPLATNHLLSTWTGQALFSFNATAGAGASQPGNASGYDPVSNEWTRLPAAPSGCDTPAAPIWTGREVLMYCPQQSAGSGSSNGGLSFTPG